MMDASPIDLGLWGEVIHAVALGGARAAGLMAVAPFLIRGTLTGLARTGTTLAIALPVVPMVLIASRSSGQPAELWLVLPLVAKEVLLGVLLALPLAMLAWGVEAAGELIDVQRGAAGGGTQSAATGNQASLLGSLTGRALVTWLFLSGVFRETVDMLYRSYLIWPAWAMLPDFSHDFGARMLGLLDSMMRCAVVAAGPAVVAMLLAELGLGLVGRFAPNLQVYFVAMPVKSGIAVLLLALSLGAIMQQAALDGWNSAEALQRVGDWLR